MHSYFDSMNMFSIESEKIVYQRQLFNTPYSCISVNNTVSSSFITDYNQDANSILWLDFADSRAHREQLGEFESFLTKAWSGDIVKITLNANPGALVDGSQTNKVTGKRYLADELNQARLDKLKTRIEDFLPKNVTPNDMKKDSYPALLHNVIKYVSSKAMASRPDSTVFQPLTSFYYSDSGNQMMTMTGAILEEERVKSFIDETKLANWNLSTLEWGSCKKISVPPLTSKEKSFIDQMLPNSSTSDIIDALGFSFAEDDKLNQEMVEGYRQYYRYYPSFHKVTF